MGIRQLNEAALIRMYVWYFSVFSCELSENAMPGRYSISLSLSELSSDLSTFQGWGISGHKLNEMDNMWSYTSAIPVDHEAPIAD